MTGEENPFKPPASTVADQSAPSEKKQNPGAVWILVTLVITAVNLLLKYEYASAFYNSTRAGLEGYVVGGAVLAPLIVVLLFQLGKNFRNNRSRVKIFFWMSALGVLSSLSAMFR